MTSIDVALNQLVDLYLKRQVAVFLGPDLDQSLTGMPPWSDLARRLARRGGWPSMSNWLKVATRYEQTYGRRNLIDWLDTQIRNPAQGSLYPALAALDVAKYICLTYDNMMQSALEAAGRPANTVAIDEELGFVKPERPTVVKVLGECSAGRRHTLLVTESDLLALSQLRVRIIAQEIQPTLTGMSLLILGQDLRSPFFLDLYQRYALAPSTEAFKRRSFAIWSGLEQWEVEEWARHHVTIVDVEPLAVINHCIAAPQ